MVSNVRTVVCLAAFPPREMDASASGNGRSSWGPCALSVHKLHKMTHLAYVAAITLLVRIFVISNAASKQALALLHLFPNDSKIDFDDSLMP